MTERTMLKEVREVRRLFQAFGGNFEEAVYIAGWAMKKRGFDVTLDRLKLVFETT